MLQIRFGSDRRSVLLPWNEFHMNFGTLIEIDIEILVEKLWSVKLKHIAVYVHLYLTRSSSNI